MKGLKAEPGWRCACVTWLNLLRSKSKPPTSDTMAPSFGRIDDERRLGLGQLGDRPPALVVLRQTDDRAAADAGRRRGLVADRPRDKAQAVAANLHLLAVGQHGG